MGECYELGRTEADSRYHYGEIQEYNSDPHFYGNEVLEEVFFPPVSG